MGYSGKDAVDTRLVQQAADAGPECGEIQGSRGRGVKAIDADRPWLGEEGFCKIHLDRGMYFQQEKRVFAMADQVGAKDVSCGGLHAIIDLPESVVEKGLGQISIERCAK
jgi:hypothetical protein